MVFNVMAFKLRARGQASTCFEKRHSEYLKALLDSHLLLEEAQLDTDFLYDQKVIEFVKFAIQATKDTILYLSEMMDLLPASAVPPLKKCFDDNREQLQQLHCILVMLRKEETTVCQRHNYSPPKNAISYAPRSTKTSDHYSSKHSPEGAVCQQRPKKAVEI